jgi:hypothetical protein
MQFGIEILDKEFRDALGQYQKASGKTFAEVINKKAKDVALRSVQFTPKARLNKIRKYEPNGRSYARKLLHARATQGTRLGKAKKGEGNKPLAEKLYKSRLQSRGYIAAGWIKAARELGAPPSRGVAKLQKGGRANKGGAKPANPSKLFCDILNMSIGAETVGLEPLQRALDFVKKDMQQYIDRKLAPVAKKYSAR